MNWEDKHVLITGISGFVGSHLASRLVKEGAKVFGIVRWRADGTPSKNLVDRGVFNRVHLIEGNIMDMGSLARALDFSEPEYILHMASQSFVPRSFMYPMETLQTNTIGTANLLEAIRLKEHNPTVLFAGSSEQYGLVFSSEKDYELAKERWGSIFPEPTKIPELPVNESAPFRPMSPYGVSKVQGEYLMRNYYHTYGIRTIISRAFNHEGAGRGPAFVSSSIALQVIRLKLGETEKITIGNPSAFRDWSHVSDIVNGYLLLCGSGRFGEAYNQGSMRTNSVLTLLLITLREAGWHTRAIQDQDGTSLVSDPLEEESTGAFGLQFEITKLDQLLLSSELVFPSSDRLVKLQTSKGDVRVAIDAHRFRPTDVPILLCDCRGAKTLGFHISFSLRDVARELINYYLNEQNRVLVAES